MKDILCPLLELCAKDDSTLAITICGLLLWLLKRMTDPSYKALADLQKKSNSSKLMVEIESSGRKKLVSSELITQQIWALCTFKEALCSEKGNDAITNAFKELWEKEQIATDELNKLGVAKCFSYMRRILSIDAHPLFSSPAEHIQNKIAHNKLIFQFRVRRRGERKHFSLGFFYFCLYLFVSLILMITSSYFVLFEHAAHISCSSWYHRRYFEPLSHGLARGYGSHFVLCTQVSSIVYCIVLYCIALHGRRTVTSASASVSAQSIYTYIFSIAFIYCCLSPCYYYCYCYYYYK